MSLPPCGFKWSYCYLRHLPSLPWSRRPLWLLLLALNYRFRRLQALRRALVTALHRAEASSRHALLVILLIIIITRRALPRFLFLTIIITSGSSSSAAAYPFLLDLFRLDELFAEHYQAIVSDKHPVEVDDLTLPPKIVLVEGGKLFEARIEVLDQDFH